MYHALVKDQNGLTLNLTGQEDKWAVTSITGLSSPPVTLNTSSYAGFDGSAFNSAKVGARNIVITLMLNGDFEDSREALYKFFPPKKQVEFRFSNASRKIKINCYVESTECDFFSDNETMQISLMCLDPWFISTDPNDVTTRAITINTLVVSTSEIPTGAVMTFTVTSQCSRLKVENVESGEYLTLYYTFNAGDIVTVNTQSGSRSIMLTRNGTTSNLVSAFVFGSSFLQIPVGSSHFTFTATGGDASLSVVYTAMFRGV